MIVWVMYDIQSDKVRSRIAKICQQAGLLRVQYSVFLGTITSNEKDELELKISDLIQADVDRVYIFPMSKNELQDTVLLGQAFDKKYVTNEVKAIFL